LLALLCLVLDDSSRSALVVDRKLPTSAAKLASAFVAAWPRLGTRVSYVTADVAEVLTGGDDLLVSVHACGALTDAVLDLALSSGTRIAVMPCCHDARTNDLGGLGGWMDPSLAIDVVRADRLRRAGYTVVTQTIHPGITEKRRLLMGSPAAILPRVACLPVRK
jgi:hypothetical protein